MTTLKGPKGIVKITTTKCGYTLTSPQGTNHTCVGRNKFYSACILERKLILFYGRAFAFRALDAHFGF